MSTTAPNAEALEEALLAVYNAYIDSFNAGDVTACVSNFFIPYYDLRNVEGSPTQVLFATEAESRTYFEDTLAAMAAAGWKGSSRVVQTSAWRYAEGMACLLVDFERLTADREPIDAHRVFYNFAKDATGTWKIAGYIAADPDHLGPGNVARTG